ncbi:MAG: GNAT family N-acetyltransferase [Vicinamibacterales bacterium]
MDQDEALRAGITRRAANGADILYRFAGEGDSVEAMTELLHRAYAPLAQAGLHYMASHQAPDVTRRRMGKGQTVVAATPDGTIVGTVTLARASATSGSPFYDQPDVASFGQFGVETALQNLGIGSTLLSVVEALALQRGVGHLALDTSEQAAALIRLYTSRGYRLIETAQWPDVNYRSVILAKARAQLRRTV